jgi:hypothetical protein
MEVRAMPFQAILREVDQLQSVSTRLEALAEQHPLFSEPLMTIAGNEPTHTPAFVAASTSTPS